MTIEQRKSARKILRIKATISIDDAGSISANTMDIGKFGMSLVNIQKPIAMGQRISVAFDILSAGSLSAIDITASVAYCIPVYGEGYKIGLQFLNLDSDSAIAIAQYVAH